MQTEPGPDRASFEATLTKGVTSEPYRFTVLAQHDGASPDPRLPIGDCADGPVRDDRPLKDAADYLANRSSAFAQRQATPANAATRPKLAVTVVPRSKQLLG